VLNGTQESLLAQVKFYRELFGEDYYFELSRHTMNDGDIRADGMLLEPWLYQQYQSYTDKQTKVNQALVALGQELNIPLVATNDTHYIERSDWKPHEILINIQSGEPCEIWEKDSYGNPKERVPNP